MRRRHKRRWRTYIKGRRMWKKLNRIVKREGKETRIAMKLIRKSMRKNVDLSSMEKKFIRGQLRDLARMLPIAAAQAVPLPIPITPALIVFGKKVGIDFIPKEQEMSKSMLKDEQDRKERKEKRKKDED